MRELAFRRWTILRLGRPDRKRQGQGHKQSHNRIQEPAAEKKIIAQATSPRSDRRRADNANDLRRIRLDVTDNLCQFDLRHPKGGIGRCRHGQGNRQAEGNQQVSQ